MRSENDRGKVRNADLDNVIPQNTLRGDRKEEEVTEIQNEPPSTK